MGDVEAVEEAPMIRRLGSAMSVREEEATLEYLATIKRRHRARCPTFLSEHLLVQHRYINYQILTKSGMFVGGSDDVVIVVLCYDGGRSVGLELQSHAWQGHHFLQEWRLLQGSIHLWLGTPDFVEHELLSVCHGILGGTETGPLVAAVAADVAEGVAGIVQCCCL